MSKMTYFVVLPFETSKRGRFVVGQAQQAQTKHHAIRMAERLAVLKGGAVVFSRAGDNNIGEFDEAVILVKFGEVPEDILGT